MSQSNCAGRDCAHTAERRERRASISDIGTNGRLLRPEVADRLGDAGVAVIKLALDAAPLTGSTTEVAVFSR